MMTARHNDEKVVQFFAWLPVIARGKVKWLQTVRVRYRFIDDEEGGGMWSSVIGWVPMEFLEPEKI